MPSFYNLAAPILGILILAFEAWITVAGIFYPHVDKAYHDYFISHQRSFYVPPAMTEQDKSKLRRNELKISKLDMNSVDFLLKSGWYPPESFGAWSDGGLATLELPRDGSKKILIAQMLAFAPRVPQQVKLYIDDHFIEEATLHDGFNTLLMKVPDGTNDLLQISFYIAHPGSPASVGSSGDTRQLGIGLISLEWH